MYLHHPKQRYHCRNYSTFADVFAACIGEADIAARIIRNLDSFRDFACGKRFDGLRIAECHIFIIVERHFDTGEFAPRFVLKRDFLVGVGNLLGDIGVGFQAIGVPGVVCAILQAVRVKDMVPMASTYSHALGPFI